MNWKRIWSGGIIAGFVIFALDFLINVTILGQDWQALTITGQIQPMHAYTLPVIFIQEITTGLVLTWLYALARPRLGPGPKTAFLMGTLAWFLIWGTFGVNQFLWCALPARVIWIPVVGGLIQCWVGIYLAGWQYIELAP